MGGRVGARLHVHPRADGHSGGLSVLAPQNARLHCMSRTGFPLDRAMDVMGELEGTWHIVATTFPMWLSGKRTIRPSRTPAAATSSRTTWPSEPQRRRSTSAVSTLPLADSSSGAATASCACSSRWQVTHPPGPLVGDHHCRQDALHPRRGRRDHSRCGTGRRNVASIDEELARQGMTACSGSAGRGAKPTDGIRPRSGPYDKLSTRQAETARRMSHRRRNVRNMERTLPVPTRTDGERRLLDSFAAIPPT